MRHTNRLLVQRAALATLGIIALACSDTTHPGTDGLLSARAESSLPRSKEAPVLDDEARAIAALTRVMAVGMKSAAVRALLRNDLREKGVTRERKLSAQRHLLSSTGNSLMRVLATSSGAHVDSIRGLLGRIRPLEIYLPVRAQRDAWTGGDIIVASQLRESDTPVGFTEDGEEASMSLTRAPSTTTVAIVAVETNFDQPAYADLLRRGTVGGASRLIDCDDASNCESGDPGGSGGTGTVPADAEPGLYMTYSGIYDLMEPWIKGDPEIEVHVMGPSISDPPYDDSVACLCWRNSGESALL